MNNKCNLYFYNKLYESNQIFNQNSQKSIKKRFSARSRLHRIFLNTLIAIFSILKCLFLKKGKALFFNHTQRTRNVDNQNKIPLYLNHKIFNADNFYYIDNDSDILISYVGPKAILDIAKLNTLISILVLPAKILNKFKKSPLTESELHFYEKVNFWHVILKILKPSKIMFVVWYGNQPIITAAKKIGIQTIDLQHGIIYENHPFYNIKNLDSKALKNYTLPDECWVYGAYWKNELIKAGWSENKIKVFGYYLNIPKKMAPNLFPYILYTTSCTANKEEVLNHIKSIINQVRNRGFKIIISPHPHEDRNNYKDILSDIVSLSEKDSYELLLNCQVHISAFSTLLWEGLYFNKSTYILDFDTYKNHIEILNELIQNKLARTIAAGEFPKMFKLKNDLKISDIYFSPVEKITL